MRLTGTAHVYGDDINTDYIIAGKYRSICLDLKSMAAHALEDLDADFVKRVKPGDFLVGGKNFGCGSSREYAPKVLLEAGVAAILAPSFGRIFYRNYINSGLPPLECATDTLRLGDVLEIDLEAGLIHNKTQNSRLRFQSIPPFMTAILAAGGMVAYLQQYGALDMSKFK